MSYLPTVMIAFKLNPYWVPAIPVRPLAVCADVLDQLTCYKLGGHHPIVKLCNKEHIGILS